MPRADSLNVVFIGAGSAVFGPATIYDTLNRLLRTGGTLALVDTDEQALSRMHAVAERMASHLGTAVTVESSTDRRAVLTGADAVIIAAEADRIERWRIDWEIPQRFGIRHTLGENRGPAGLSHTLRTVPLVLAMGRDIEELAPSATVIVMTNPEDRIAYALHRYTGLRAFGYCDGLWDFKHHYLEELLGIPGERIFVEAAGINHAVWITALIDTGDGSDLYPRLLAEARSRNWQPFGRHLYHRYGLWPHENDEHYGEYFDYACDFIDCRGYDFEAHRSDERRWKEAAEAVVAGTGAIASFVADVAETVWDVFGDAPPSLVIEGVLAGTPRYLPNANIPNDGHIPGLPAEMIVEVPGVATPSGIRGVGVHPLNTALRTFLHREGVIQRLAAEAAAEGSREKALAALEKDTHVSSSPMAAELLDAFLQAHADYIPPETLRGLAGEGR